MDFVLWLGSLNPPFCFKMFPFLETWDAMHVLQKNPSFPSYVDPASYAKLGYFKQWWFFWFQCDIRFWNATHSSVQKPLELCNHCNFRAPFFSPDILSPSMSLFLTLLGTNITYIPFQSGTNLSRWWFSLFPPFCVGYVSEPFPGRVMEQQLTTPKA